MVLVTTTNVATGAIAGRVTLRKLAHGPAYKPSDMLKTDRVHHRGTHAYIGGSHAAE